LFGGRFYPEAVRFIFNHRLGRANSYNYEGHRWAPKSTTRDGVLAETPTYGSVSTLDTTLFSS
jgi:hypothetical protein